MADKILEKAHIVGHFFVSDIYAFYLDTYKGSLGKVQVEALDHIHNVTQVSVKDLAEKLNISKQHASKIVARLEGDRYLSKERSDEDARSNLYSLTEKGKKFIEEHIAISNAHLLEYVGSLSRQDREKFAKSLEQLAEIINGMH